jgi:hypothetical protein
MGNAGAKFRSAWAESHHNKRSKTPPLAKSIEKAKLTDAVEKPSEPVAVPASQVDAYPDLPTELDRSLCSGTSAAAVAARAKTSYEKLEGQEEMSLETSPTSGADEPARGGRLHWQSSEGDEVADLDDGGSCAIIPHPRGDKPTHYILEFYTKTGVISKLDRFKSLDAAKAAAEKHADEISKAKATPAEPSATEAAAVQPSDEANPPKDKRRQRAKAVIRDDPSLTKRKVMERANCGSKCAHLAREELVKAGEIPANPRARKASAA